MRIPDSWPKATTLSVIVPVYNEQGTLSEVLRRLVDKQLPGLSIEVIVVESNSTDGSRQTVESFRHHPRIRVIWQPHARGKGHAVRAGLAVATGQIVLIQDADLEYDMDDYGCLLAPILSGETTFVLGARAGESGWGVRRFEHQPWTALLFNAAHWGFALLLNASLFIRLSDPFTMYKVFRRECVEGIDFTCDRFDFDWELLIKLVRTGHRPVELPVRYRSRSFRDGKKIRMLNDPVTWLRAWVVARFSPLRPPGRGWLRPAPALQPVEGGVPVRGAR